MRKPELYVSPNGVVFVKWVPPEVISSMWIHPTVNKLSLHANTNYPYRPEDWVAMYWRVVNPTPLHRGPMISAINGVACEVKVPVIAPGERESSVLQEIAAWEAGGKQDGLERPS